MSIIESRAKDWRMVIHVPPRFCITKSGARLTTALLNNALKKNLQL
jgi:hypothetical protein